MKHFSPLAFFLLSLFLMTLLSCTTTREQGPARSRGPAKEIDNTLIETPIPRADPGFLQYLEKKSLLNNAAEMAKVVSGSHLGWQATGSSGTIDQLLQQSDTWISLNPFTLVLESRRDTFGFLSESRFWSVLRSIGIKGLYVAPTGPTGKLWNMDKDSKAPNTGEDVVQYTFSQTAGSDQTYGYLMNRINDEHAVIGSDLIPAATGIGPDFFLGTRNIREYPGVYCLVEIPKDLWGSLPVVTNNWEGVALSSETTQALNAKGFLPKTMLKDTLVGGGKVGWAATTQITDVNGNAKRWIYRYYNDPSQPILNWEDPSRAASRILSGSIINQVGYLGQNLVGMRFEAFRGLDAAGGIRSALSASQALHGEIKRYGAWSWLRDRDLTIDEMAQFLSTSSDFVLDNAMSPGAEHALMTGDATLLRYMTDKLIASGIDTKRLVHAMPSYDGISYSLGTVKKDVAMGDKSAATLLSSVLGELSAAVAGQKYMPVKKQVLYTTSTGLASMGLSTKNTSNTKGMSKEVAKGHSLLVFFKAMQPGLLMLSGQDLVGAMPLDPSAMGKDDKWDTSYAARGTYSLYGTSGTFVHSGQSIPKTQNMYSAADVQVMDKSSFLHQIGTFLRKRTEIGIAGGRLVERLKTQGHGTIALVSKLPSGSTVLTVCNFSRSPVTENLPASRIPNLGNNRDVGGNGSYLVNDSTITVSLGPWQGKAILFGNVSKSTISKKNSELQKEMVDPAQGMYPDEQLERGKKRER